MRVTLKMVAEEAGVSVMAASAVLNHTRSTRVSPERRRIIMKIAQELGYSPNLLARALHGGKSKIIGVIIDSYAPLSAQLILRYIESEASRRGYRIITAEEHDSPSDVIDACKIFDQYGADGVICMAHDYPGQNSKIYESVQAYSNIVFLEKAEGCDHPYVTLSSFEAHVEALRLLKASERKTALLIPHQPVISLQNRILSFKEAAAQTGSEVICIDIPLLHSGTDIMICLEELIQNTLLPMKINAVLLCNDLYGAAFLSVMSKLGLRCPEDFAVIGWDNHDFCETLLPPLASIDSNLEAVGCGLVQLLLNQLNGKSVQPIIIKPRLILRNSIGLQTEKIKGGPLCQKPMTKLNELKKQIFFQGK